MNRQGPRCCQAPIEKTFPLPPHPAPRGQRHQPLHQPLQRRAAAAAPARPGRPFLCFGVTILCQCDSGVWCNGAGTLRQLLRGRFITPHLPSPNPTNQTPPDHHPVKGSTGSPAPTHAWKSTATVAALLVSYIRTNLTSNSGCGSERNAACRTVVLGYVLGCRPSRSSRLCIPR